MQDFSFRNCIRNHVVEVYPESRNIIFNINSKISKEIKNYEETLIQITSKIFPNAVQLLKDYKNGKVEETKLCVFILEFENEFKIKSVESKIQDYANECRMQLNGIKFEDGKSELYDKLFTDEEALNEWFKTDRTDKILLKNDGNQSNNFKYLNILFS